MQLKQDIRHLDTAVFLIGPTPASFSFIFVFSNNYVLQFLQQINVKKCPSSIRRQDSNSQPSDYESPPLTTRPGYCCFYPGPFLIIAF